MKTRDQLVDMTQSSGQSSDGSQERGYAEDSIWNAERAPLSAEERNNRAWANINRILHEATQVQNPAH